MNFHVVHTGRGRVERMEYERHALMPQRIRPLGNAPTCETKAERQSREDETARQIERAIGSPVRYGLVRLRDRAMSQCAYILPSGYCCGKRTARGSWCQKHYDKTHVRRAG